MKSPYTRYEIALLEFTINMAYFRADWLAIAANLPCVVLCRLLTSAVSPCGDDEEVTLDLSISYHVLLV